jgi:hypothetical protein
MKSESKLSWRLWLLPPVAVLLITYGTYFLITGEPIPAGGGTGTHGGSGRIGGSLLMLEGAVIGIVFYVIYRRVRRSGQSDSKPPG